MLAYRPEIDGLRAVAVMAVLLFHLDFGILPGGFIGVDVFFVISGFLITSIILRELQDGTFTLAGFYERRIRRILPAAFLVIAAMLIAGYFLLLPRDYAALAASSFSAVFYVSNFYFWRQEGYFQTAAKEQPLLHTWSLSVEEQFYILFPVFIILAVRFLGRDGTFWLLLICALGSLALAEWLVNKDQDLAFYMLPSRGWQLGFGALLAFGKLPQTRKFFIHEVAGLAGLALIIWPLFFYSAQTPFPGLAALPPTLGAVLIIYGAAQQGFVARVLSLRFMTLIGKISYSLYLWHWPLIALALYRFGEMPDDSGKIAILLASVLLAFLSWRFVENPLRNRAFLPGFRIFAALGLCSVMLAALSGGVVMSKGLPQRIDPEIATMESAADDYNPLRDLCNDAPLLNHADHMSACEIGDLEQAQVQALLWGDSVADSFSPGVSAFFKAAKIKALQSTRNNCAPLLNSFLMRSPEAETSDCQAHRQAVMDYLKQHPEIKIVVLAGSWSDVAAHIAYGRYDPSPSTPEQRLEALERVHRETIAKLREMGRTVLLIGALPYFSYNPAACLTRQKFFGDPQSFPCPAEDWRSLDMAVAGVIRLHESLSGENLAVFMPHEKICISDLCSPVNEGQILYYDPGHLSGAGARYLVPAMGDAFSGKIQ